MTLRDLALKIAFSYLGRWYKWGGDDPSGFDCSGFVVEILQSIGLIGRREDLSASALWDRFIRCKIDEPMAGALVFWKGATGNVCHVEFCIGKDHAIGATGGGSETLTEADAIRHNAYIKVRPIKSRKGIKGYLDPFMEV
jgi:D-gamma-glutamyl-meso-diaminopimelic acid endopeptidase CwlS